MKQDLPIRNTSFHPFFFSSKRRHTRCYRHWSSDVCSSDLTRIVPDDAVEEHLLLVPLGRHLQGELRREQERVRRLRVLGPEADELEELPPRLVVAILPQCRPARKSVVEGERGAAGRSAGVG